MPVASYDFVHQILPGLQALPAGFLPADDLKANDVRNERSLHSCTDEFTGLLVHVSTVRTAYSRWYRDGMVPLAIHSLCQFCVYCVSGRHHRSGPGVRSSYWRVLGIGVHCMDMSSPWRAWPREHIKRIHLWIVGFVQTDTGSLYVPQNPQARHRLLHVDGACHKHYRSRRVVARYASTVCQRFL